MPSRVKQALSETFVVIGGANVEGVVGLEAVRQFSFSTLGSASRLPQGARPELTPTPRWRRDRDLSHPKQGEGVDSAGRSAMAGGPPFFASRGGADSASTGSGARNLLRSSPTSSAASTVAKSSNG